MEQFILKIIDALPILLVALPAGWLGSVAQSYFNEKGKNLATKEDIEEITEKVETVKNQLSASYKKTSYYIEQQLLAYREIDREMYGFTGKYFNRIDSSDKIDYYKEIISSNTGGLVTSAMQACEKHSLFLSEELAKKLTLLVGVCIAFSEKALTLDNVDGHKNVVMNCVEDIRNLIKREITNG